MKEPQFETLAVFLKKHRGEKLKDYGRKKQRQAYERYWRKGFKAGVRADTMLKHGFVSDTEK